MRSNIPAELRSLDQWVVAGDNKNPLNPRTGQPASVTDPLAWGTFADAMQSGYKHIGFVLTRLDPYCIIDLDEPITPQQAERHKAIMGAFYTYTEISQSGNGVHIVCKGAIAHGVRRDKVELYSADRYMIFTGTVLNNAPIADYQEVVSNMHAQMASTVVTELEELPPVCGDDEIYTIGARATNSDKFVALFTGSLQGYPSQSEADFALLSMLAFYSQSNEQVRRLFRFSELGKRDKAQRNDQYIDRCLAKIRAKQMTPRVDLTQFLANVMAPKAEAEQMSLPLLNAGWSLPALPIAPIAPPPPPPMQTCIFPPGLIGEMADYIYSSAIRPVHEVALCAAIAFGAGIMGRHFNISGTGLNQYLILLAKTGTGKEGAASGMNMLASAIRPQVPIIDDFLGPSAFASGQALTRRLDAQPSFVSVLGEVGLLLKQICAPDASAPNIQLRRVLLDLFGKSGFHSWLRPSVYSDVEKNTQSIKAPNVTILGESTPENFFNALDVAHVSEGLIPRFLVIQYDGLRPPMNQRAFHPPAPGLAAQLVKVCQVVLTMKANDTCCPVNQDRNAAHLFEQFNEMADQKINGSGEDEMLKQLWNRAHLKALKLAALVAVGQNIQAPTIDKVAAQWAIDLVTKDITNMLGRFSSGEVGQGDHNAHHDLMKAVAKWRELTAEQRKQYGVPSAFQSDTALVPYKFFRRYLCQRSAFKNHKLGAVQAIKSALEDAVKQNELCQVPHDQARVDLNTDSPVYYVP